MANFFSYFEKSSHITERVKAQQLLPVENPHESLREKKKMKKSTCSTFFPLALHCFFTSYLWTSGMSLSHHICGQKNGLKSFLEGHVERGGDIVLKLLERQKGEVLPADEIALHLFLMAAAQRRNPAVNLLFQKRKKGSKTSKNRVKC